MPTSGSTAGPDGRRGAAAASRLSPPKSRVLLGGSVPTGTVSGPQRSPGGWARPQSGQGGVASPARSKWAPCAEAGSLAEKPPRGRSGGDAREVLGVGFRPPCQRQIRRRPPRGRARRPRRRRRSQRRPRGRRARRSRQPGSRPRSRPRSRPERRRPAAKPAGTPAPAAKPAGDAGEGREEAGGRPATAVKKAGRQEAGGQARRGPAAEGHAGLEGAGRARRPGSGGVLRGPGARRGRGPRRASPAARAGRLGGGAAGARPSTTRGWASCPGPTATTCWSPCRATRARSSSTGTRPARPSTPPSPASPAPRCSSGSSPAAAEWERVRVVDVALEARGWYVHDLEPGRAYRAELHVIGADGQDRLLPGPSHRRRRCRRRGRRPSSTIASPRCRGTCRCRG